MRVLVCGSRTFVQDRPIRVVLDGLRPSIVIHGDARGADAIAAAWADQSDVVHLRCPADWATHGKAAGPIRNQEMLDHHPDLVVAFVDKPLATSKGTADMVHRARKANVRTWVVEL